MTLPVKICCILDEGEADLAISAGARVLGFVGEQPSGPGRLPDARIAEIIAHVGGRVECWLLTSTTAPDALAAQIARVRPSAVQICDRVADGIYARIRGAFPGLRLIQVVHVTGPEALAEARRVRPHVDAILLDSGTPTGPQRQLGGTGRTHDWAVSRDIVAQVKGPVWLAGGLKVENVGVAIRRVHPAGVDLCSGVRDAGFRLDPVRLSHFMLAVERASGPVELPKGAAMGDYQRYIQELEAQQGWLDADLVENGFLMVEEIGELYASVRRYRRALARGDAETAEKMRLDAGEEIVDVLNYLLATANRLGIDVEASFRAKNTHNQGRTWE